jgi:hypothetical protein
MCILLRVGLDLQDAAEKYGKHSLNFTHSHQDKKVDHGNGFE